MGPQHAETLRPNKLRELRRTFSHSKCGTDAQNMELLHYGTVTLIHKKLDSWIDSKPPDLHNKFTCQNDVFTVEDSKSDHKQQRVDRLAKSRGRLARTWSGSMHRLPRGVSPTATSLIDSHPKKTPVSTEKRTKPRTYQNQNIGRPHSPGSVDQDGENPAVEIKQCKNRKPSFKRVVRRTKSFDPPSIMLPTSA